LKARFNANLGNVLKMEPNMDIYPGLDLGYITLAHILVSAISLPKVLDYLVKLEYQLQHKT
jgi:hypothetical protein